MKTHLLRLSKQSMQLITRITILLVALGFFAAPAFSQITGTTPASRCGEGSVVLGATASAGTIKWYADPFYGTALYTGATFTTPSLAATTTYYVDAIDANGCSKNSGGLRIGVTATISENAIQAAIFYASSTFCKSSTPQTITLTGTAGGVFSVNPSTGLSINATGSITPSSSSANTYTITYTAPPTTGCIEEPATTTVSIVDAPVTPGISYSGSPWCTSETAKTVTHSGASGGSYSATPSGLIIDTGNGTITPNGSLTGTYTVTYFVSGAGGCEPQTATTSVTILQLPTASISYAGPFTMNQGAQSVSRTGSGVYTGGTYTKTVGAGTLTLDASTGAITPSSSAAGTYTITYTLAAVSPCAQVTATTSVTINDIPTAVLSGTNSICSGGSANLSIAFTGAAPFTYTYTVGSMPITATASTNPEIIAVSPGNTTTYTLTAVNDVNGSGSVSGSAVITVAAAQFATFEYSGSPYCSNGTNPSPNLLGVGTLGNFTSTAGLSVTASTGEINLLTSTAGTYTVTNTIASTGGCPEVTHQSAVTITKLPIASFSYELGAYCTNGTNPSPVMVTDAVKGLFSSTAGLEFVSLTSGEINLAASTPGNYTVTNTIAAATGCDVVPATTTVEIKAIPAALAGSGRGICAGTSTQIGAAAVGTNTYSWSASPTDVPLTETTSAQPTVSPTVTTTYTVVESNGSCTNTHSMTVSILSRPAANAISGPAVVCAGSTSVSYSVTDHLSDGGLYEWQYTGRGATLSSLTTPAITIDFSNTATSGQLKLTETLGGCSTLNTYNITVDELPIAAAGPDQTLCNTATFTMAARPTVGTGAWSFIGEHGTAVITTVSSATTTITTVPTDLNITLSWTETNGTCSSTDNVVIRNNALPTIALGANPNVTIGTTTADLTYSATTETPTSYSITWNDSPTNSFVAVTGASLPESTITISIPASTAAGTYTGTITVKNANGCVSEGTAFTVTVYLVRNITQRTNYTTIQGAIDAANTNDVIQVASGTYRELVTVNKSITLQGVSSAATIIKNLSNLNGNEIIITVAANNVTLKDFAIEGFLTAAGVGTTGIYFNSTVSTILIENVISRVHNCALFADALANVSHLTLTNTNLTNSAYGFFIYNDLTPVAEHVAKMSNLVITNGSISDNTMWGFGSYIVPGTTGNSDNLNNVAITGTTFSNNALKGLYFETLKNAVFTNLTISNCGSKPVTNGSTYYTHNAGIDMNLKGGTYSNIQILNSTITGCGLGDPNGGGILIKSRAIGGYSTYPGTLDGVTLTGNTITNNGNGTWSVGVRIGESNNSFTGGEPGPTNVAIHHNILTGNSAHALRNATTSTDNVDAINNYWGDPTGPLNAATNPCGTGNAVSDNVTFIPWWTTSTGVDGSGTITVAPVITTITTEATTVVTGTSESNAAITVYKNGTTAIGTTTADGSGNWAATVTTPATNDVITAKATATPKCVSAASASKTIPVAPTGSDQTFYKGDARTVAYLTITAAGEGIKWYPSATGGSVLEGSTVLVTGTHYYASQTVSGSESTDRLNVLVTVNPVENMNTSVSYPTIQGAINAALTGNTINVAAGTYTEQLIVGGQYNLTMHLTFKGSNAGISAGATPGVRNNDETILIGGFHLFGASSEIDGFTIQNGFNMGHYSGVVVGNANTGAQNVTIKNNIIKICIGSQSNGIEVVGGSNNLQILNNEIVNNWRGIYLNATSGINIAGNAIHANNGVGVGIGSDGQSNLTVTGNKIYDQSLEGWGMSAVGLNVSAHNNSFLNNLVSIAHYGGSAVNASCNWWGQASGPAGGQTSGSVTYLPWLVSDNLTIPNCSGGQ